MHADERRSAPGRRPGRGCGPRWCSAAPRRPRLPRSSGLLDAPARRSRGVSTVEVDDRLGRSVGACASVAHATFPSITRSRTRDSSISVGRPLVDDASLTDDQHAVGEPEHLLDLAGHDHDGDAGVGERADQARRSRCGPRRRRRASARRAAAPGTRAAASAPAPPSAGCRPTACGPRGPPPRVARRATRQLLASRRSARLVEQAEAGEAAQRRHRDVAVDRLVEQQALALALLGAQPDPGGDGGGTEPRRSVCAVDADRAGGGAAGAVDRLEDLRAPGSDQAGEADDLAGADGEVDVARTRRRAPGRAPPARRRRSRAACPGAAGRRTRSSGRSSA